MTPLEGVNLYAYGHSYIGADYNGQTSAQRYPARVAKRLGMVHVNRGVPGYWAQDVALDAIGGTNPARNFAPGAPGVVLWDASANDIKDNGPSAPGMSGYRHAVRAFAHYVSLSSRVEDDSGTVGKVGCSVQPIVDFSGGHNVFGPAGTYTEVGWYVTGPMKQGIGVAAIDGAQGGVFDVVLDGVTVASYSAKAQCLRSPNGNPYVPIMIPIDIPAGYRNVRIKSRAPYGEGPYFDFYGAYSATPPLVVLVKPVYLPSYAAWPGKATDGVVDAYAAILDEVAAELPNVITVDPRPGWNPATMIGGDGLHPSARGNDHLASVVVDALEEAVADFLPGVTR